MREILKNSTNFLFRKQNGILSAAFVIAVTYGLSSVMGLVRTRLLISYFFGSQANLLDVYYAAFLIPDTIFQLLVIGALSAAFIPTFTRILNKDETQAWDMASTTINLVLLVFTLVAAVIFVFAWPMSRLIAPGFSLSQTQTMVLLLRIMLGAQLFFSVSGFLTGILQSHQRFLISALAPLMYNLGIILGIVFLSGPLGILGPTLGVVLGAVLHMLVQLPLAYKLGLRFSTSLNFNLSGVREVITHMPARALTLGIDQIEQYVAVFLTSLLSVGSLSILNVARTLYALPTLLFGATIGQAALPALSKMSNDLSEFRQTLVSSFLQIAFLALPVSTLFIILRIPIVRIIFGSKSFPWEATLLTGQTLAVLATSAAFYAVMQLVIRGFYALHDTRTPLFIGLGGAVFNAVASIFVVTQLGWGVVGIAAAISITAILETSILIVVLYRRIGGIDNMDQVAMSLLKMIIISFITGLGLWIPMRLLDQFIFDTTRTLPLLALSIITFITGFSVYLILSKIMQVEQLSAFTSLIGKLKRWKEILATTAPESQLVINE